MQGAFQVETAVSVEEAVRKLEEKTYDAIVSDYQMPTKDGLEFLKELREKGDNVPFIILTGKGREEVAIKALNLGADQYLNKMGDPEAVYGELAHSIRRAVERKRAEKMLKESEEKYRNLFENARDVTLTLDLKGKITSINKAAVQYGFKKDEIIGKNQLEFVPKKYWPRLLKELVQIARGKTVEGQIEINTPKGKKIAGYRSDPIIIDDKVVGIQVILRDITERKKMLEELSNSEERLNILFEFAPDAYYLSDLKGNFIDGNKAAEELTGYDKGELIGKSFLKLKLLPRRQIPKAAQLLAKNALGKPTGPDEFTLNRKDGTQVPIEITTVPMKFKDQNIVLGIARDITERKKAEQAIRKSQQKFKWLFMNNPEAADYLDPDFHKLNVNPRFEELFGYSLGEIKGKHVNDVLVPKDKIEEAEMLDKKAEKGYVSHDTLRMRKDGSLVPVSISAAPIIIEGQLIGTVGLYRDITKQKKVEEELEESRRHFQTLFNLMVDPVVIIDGKGKFLGVTDRVEEITGFKKEELLGKNFLRTKIVTAKSKAILIKNLAKRMMGMHIPPYEVEVLTKDGRKLPYEINATKIEYKGKPADLVAFRDISKRKKAMEKLKILNEKLGVVGKLTRHDVRNKLSAITGNVYLAEKELTDNQKPLKYLKEIESAARQTERIFDFARAYEKLGVEELVYMDMTKTVGRAVMLFSDFHGVKVVNECHGLTVLADSLLIQLFYNLIDNSLKYGEKVSQIRVYYEEAGKDKVKLVYEDDGVGIPRSEKEKIFREGYGKGTGYGLYLIRKMCEVYGWTIRETGTPGKGAQFTITIPKIRESGKTSYKLQQMRAH